MESIALKAALRGNTGKKASKTVREQEGFPCVVYGGKDNVNCFVKESDFRGLLHTPKTYLIALDIDGDKRNVVIKDMQFHPVTDNLLHVDFYEVSDKKPITVEIPITLTGSSVGVREGGKLVLERRKIAVKGIAKNIPAEILVDVTELSIGKSIRTGELTTDKYEFAISKDTPIVSVRSTRASAAAAETAAKA